MLKRILQYLSLCIALVSLLILAGCSSNSASSQSKGPEGEWIAYSGYTVQNVVSAVDTPIFTMNLTARNDSKTIYTADMKAYNYQYTTPEKRPVIESTQMVGDIKEARLNYITALTLVMSANDIVGNADSSNSIQSRWILRTYQILILFMIQKQILLNLWIKPLNELAIRTIYKHWPMRISKTFK